jgi:hypothetical protein
LSGRAVATIASALFRRGKWKQTHRAVDVVTMPGGH